ncbi:MAG: hypothetical protein GWM92_12280, partial [Gemmatimonadetes bacterium]|nr:hypothetical protein [Gemmatimonadota bacterium]NIR79474.1 hypothetical protein [Gemmatimonadota bacterium]NIT88144.1 hypothetical protein [Gemmatimonadota bacterium]NIU31966.1 hypothetical protein [Gemmatimonadota bacterium]NIU36578.1 hypothetical protein [Gemmatimonadota bacterium]
MDLRDDETGRALRSVLAQPKRLALLAYLALARPRGAYERDTLLALFWPEASESRARNALNQALFFLRRRLGDEAIRSVGTALELDRERVWCDAVAFGARRETEPRAALELYRGELMRGFHLSGCPGFERWLDGERERLRGLAVETALDLAAREAGADNAVGAVSWSRKAARWAPYQERVARELITRLEEAGDLSGALKAFEAVRRRCVQELGSAPGGEVQGIADGIRRRMRSEAPSGDADPRPRTVGGGPGSP